MKIQEKLFSMQDIQYKNFQSKLIPNIDYEKFIGVRTPEIKKYAKELIKSDNYSKFLKQIPHRYFDENQLHAMIISEFKDYNTVIEEIEKFLPYVDNWATCDQLRPKILKKNTEKLIKNINNWLSSDKTYTIRFGIGMLMCYYPNNTEYLEKVSEIRSNEYYVNMMIAWYFATALAKQYDSAILYIENCILDKWIHNKTIQKAVESYRITNEQKTYLKSLKL